MVVVSFFWACFALVLVVETSVYKSKVNTCHTLVNGSFLMQARRHTLTFINFSFLIQLCRGFQKKKITEPRPKSGWVGGSRGFLQKKSFCENFSHYISGAL